MHFITWLTAWLTPVRRRAIYAALAAVGVVLVLVGVATDSVVTGWIGVVDATLSLIALILASWKARRVDWTAFYAVAAVLAGSLKVAGVISDGQESHILDLLAAAVAAAPLLIAAIRTSPKTPTGEPVDEYNAKHAGEISIDKIVIVADQPLDPDGP